MSFMDFFNKPNASGGSVFGNLAQGLQSATQGMNTPPTPGGPQISKPASNGAAPTPPPAPGAQPNLYQLLLSRLTGGQGQNMWSRMIGNGAPAAPAGAPQNPSTPTWPKDQAY